MCSGKLGLQLPQPLRPVLLLLLQAPEGSLGLLQVSLQGSDRRSAAAVVTW
jgi:hypothetical protein